MPRRLRQDVPGIHHVFARGNDRRAVFADDHDRRDYLTILGATIGHMRWRCLSYCLMNNHVHLLVEIAEGNLGRGMQRLHGLYASTFNDRHGRVGHIFQGRYGSKLVTSDEQLWWTIAYIAHNPVDAGLCSNAGAWLWSSHRHVLNGGGPRWLDRDRLLEQFAGLGGDALRRYAQVTAAGPTAAGTAARR